MTQLKRLGTDTEGWSIYLPIALDAELDSAGELIQQFRQLPVTLKDDKRSLVVRGTLATARFNGRQLDIVAKQFRDKNRRYWSRLLSLVRRSEAMHSLQTLCRFANSGIPSVTPLLVLEQRRCGMVVDSWLVYEFRDGRLSSKQDLPQIMQLLAKLHKNGMRHEDPNYGNFLIDQKEMFLIDCKGKPRRGVMSDSIDYLLLPARNADITVDEIAHAFDRQKLGYWLARWYQAYRDFRSRLKRRLRAK